MDTAYIGFALVMMASLIVAMLAIAPLAVMLIAENSSGLQLTTQREAPADYSEARAA